ncbi:MAG: LytTR family transcriptional regulator [Oscillospiraceae bacterium]|nr:LytTR family transcriptional regulator [Oscillospiraceae bacterium]
MKFELILNKEASESVVATVRERTELIDKIESMVMAHDKSDRIPAYTEDGMRILKFSEIDCITVIESRTIAIDSRGRRYRLRYRLHELEQMVPSSFIRINKSSIANENRIKEFTQAFSGAVDVVFRCGYREYVSRRCFSAIKRRYQ